MTAVRETAALAGLPRINPDRLWRSLMQLAEIGAMANGGVCRLAGSQEDGRARDLFRHWCIEAGLEVRVDGLGNMFARRDGSDGRRASILIGSHLDTQPVGGKFDGAFGVLAGLEVVRTLNEAGLTTAAPIEIVNWTNEEGCRFQPSSLGAEVAAGHIAASQGLAARDETGISLGEALSEIGYRGDHPCDVGWAGAYLEVHIEQGPILEEAGIPIGIVEGAMGINAFQIVFEGREAHTGTTPLTRRRDALLAAAQVITDVRAIGETFEPAGRATVARILVEPNARSVVASRVVLTADCRHACATQLQTMTERLRLSVHRIAAEQGLGVSMTPYWTVPARSFDPDCIAAIEMAARDLGLGHRRMVSGAGHDAIPISAAIPTAMIFVPSRGGISHHQEEYTAPEQLAAGCDVLLRATLGLAGQTACKEQNMI